MDDSSEDRPVDTRRSRIFISYRRAARADEAVARQLYEALTLEHDVFIDQISIPIGALFGEVIDAELRRADFLVTLLSAESLVSEMVLGEIQTAHRLAKEGDGRPRILPVRLAYREPFPYPVSALLDPIQYAYWGDQADTPGLIEALLRAIAIGGFGGAPGAGHPVPVEATHVSVIPPPSPWAQPLEMPEGTMDPTSPFYVERSSDGIVLETISRQGVTITIKGPRQMGKSSLLIRARDAALDLGKQVAFIDFQLFDHAALANADLFYREFCTWLGDELGMEDRAEQYWSPSLSNGMRCTRYLGRYLLKELGTPLVLAMDEVESIFDAPFRSDFFGMLRSWHNNRRPGSPWKELDLVLVTSTEPYQLIENLNQSPFNVGEVIDMADLTPEQVADLNQRHGSPLSSHEEQWLEMLLAGHPYLVRRALYLVASGRITAADLFAQATDDRGPFGDHLRHHLYRLRNRPTLIQRLGQILRSGIGGDDQDFWRLQGAGLVRKEGSRQVPRCRLYADYFREHLHV
jgi:hypothetical protein